MPGPDLPRKLLASLTSRGRSGRRNRINADMATSWLVDHTVRHGEINIGQPGRIGEQQVDTTAGEHEGATDIGPGRNDGPLAIRRSMGDQDRNLDVAEQ